ncbi:glycoside hydrolase family 3 protein [Sphingomonas rhizophila]|uniref:Glycoside hydrolase family 3 protein n=1 Tax=Sphingomonas rhizophila TaxID=2071607 RepID=A0A7G9S9J9_9SPHN|nr:glycoside hydrolase family 3 protein [Sphingomonas rhizophila]
MASSTPLALRAGIVAFSAALLASCAVPSGGANPPPPSPPPVAADFGVEARIRAIVAGMTLEQKVGQITQPDIRSIKPDEVRQYYIGSILNGGGAWPDNNKKASVNDWLKLSDAYYRASMATDMAVKIPVIWGTDAVHGHNNVFGATLFPHNIGFGAARDPALLERIGRATAAQVRATGITWAFAPTLAVVQNPRWGRTYESYSADPALVRSYGEAMTRGLQGRLGSPDSVLATAKHWIGDGGTFHGVDQGETRTTEADLFARHGQGYYGALAAGVQTVMVSYSSFTDTATGKVWGKMHGNQHLISGELKQRLRFDGLVVSDWNGIEQVPGCRKDHCPQAINAGIDLAMVPDDWKAFIANTVADVRAGRIPMQRIDDAVTRILRVKFRSGLFEASPATGPRPDPSVMNSDAVRELSREAVRKSLVLLKNDRNVLPLKRTGRILVVGKGADSLPMQAGGWSLTWQGDNTVTADYPNADTLLSALRKELGRANVDYSVDGRGVNPRRYSAIVMVAAEKPYAEMKGDIVFPAPLRHSARHPADLAALNRVSGKGVPVVTMLFSGRPVPANDLINRSDAFVAAWLPGTEGLGLTDMLLAGRAGGPRFDFTGRLPFDWPAADCLAANGPFQFRLGFGLTLGTKTKTPRLPVARQPVACPADSL